MIQESELRIGNYVNADLYGNDFILVESICSKNQDIFNSTCGEIPLSSLKPIELSEEILLKCGVVKDKVDNTYYNRDFEIMLPNYFSYKNSVLNKIKHLHQLQNLFHALTQTELEINL